MSPHALVRKTGVDLVETFLNVLPSECLRDNLNSLIIGLYPIIERANLGSIWTCFHDKRPNEAQPLPHSFPEISEAFLFDIPEQSTGYLSLVSLSVSLCLCLS
jgi:hypothetical protein